MTAFLAFVLFPPLAVAKLSLHPFICTQYYTHIRSPVVLYTYSPVYRCLMCADSRVWQCIRESPHQLCLVSVIFIHVVDRHPQSQVLPLVIQMKLGDVPLAANTQTLTSVWVCCFYISELTYQAGNISSNHCPVAHPADTEQHTWRFPVNGSNIFNRLLALFVYLASLLFCAVQVSHCQPVWACFLAMASYVVGCTGPKTTTKSQLWLLTLTGVGRKSSSLTLHNVIWLTVKNAV